LDWATDCHWAGAVQPLRRVMQSMMPQCPPPHFSKGSGMLGACHPISSPSLGFFFGLRSTSDRKRLPILFLSVRDFTYISTLKFNHVFFSLPVLGSSALARLDIRSRAMGNRVITINAPFMTNRHRLRPVSPRPYNMSCHRAPYQYDTVKDRCTSKLAAHALPALRRQRNKGDESDSSRLTIFWTMFQLTGRAP